MIQRRVFVSGRVQGVGFRAATRHVASRHTGIHGEVKNLPDGRVGAVFMGQESSVLELVSWCRQGPPSALVENLEVHEEAVDPTLPPFVKN